MVTKSKQTQEQIQAQRQTLSQHQVMFVRLLELPTEGLEERVRTEVMENPALETADSTEPSLETASDKFASTEESETEEDYTDDEDNGPDAYTNEIDEEELAALGDYRTPDDIPDYALADYAAPDNKITEEIPFTEGTSFYELMMQQLAESPLKDDERETATYLIGSLDNDGLLRKPIAVIVEELAIYRGIYTTEEEVQKALAVIQGFDPAGIGAQDLKECLALQLARKQQTADTVNAKLILEKYYDDFTHKRWERIMEGMGIGQSQFDCAIEELTRLNPRPGSSLSETVGKGMQQIIPDFYIHVDDEENVTFSLNDGNVPDLCVSSSFERMIQEYSSQKETRESREALMFLRQKVESAQTFIDLVEQRRRTLTSTMEVIVKMQHDYLVEGDETLMKPMLMKDVAEMTGLDISTISRVSASKYVETAFGIFPLKHFFGDSYRKPAFMKQNAETDTPAQEETKEETLTQRQVRVIIKECVEAEDKQAPLTDEQLVAVLKEKGYDIARRTVAKYRQQLGIPVARMRR